MSDNAVRRYRVDIHRHYKVWMAEMLEIDFPGSEEELKMTIAKGDGSLSDIPHDICYSEYLFETEELIPRTEGGGPDPFEIISIEQL